MGLIGTTIQRFSCGDSRPVPHAIFETLTFVNCCHTTMQRSEPIRLARTLALWVLYGFGAIRSSVSWSGRQAALLAGTARLRRRRRRRGGRYRTYCGARAGAPHRPEPGDTPLPSTRTTRPRPLTSSRCGTSELDPGIQALGLIYLTQLRDLPTAGHTQNLRGHTQRCRN